MKTAIMTDTNSGLTKEEARRLGVYLLPMPVIVSGQVYYEGETIDEEAFYAAQRSGAAVSTSQPSPGDVLAMWERAFAEGYEQVVYLPMSSGLSHSCEAAAALAAEDRRVHVVDNHRISFTLYQSVLRALELSEQGLEAAEIKEILEREAYQASIYIAVDTLEYLKKGGRITSAAALVGSLLNIKPVLTIQGEKLDAFAKARGMKKCVQLMAQALRDDVDTRFQGAGGGRLRAAIAGTALDGETVAGLRSALREVFPDQEVPYLPLSISIGCHTGPGAMGMAICF